MPHLKFHGKVLKQYHGLDKDTVVVAGPGDVIHVSDDKAERLLKDFPTEFEVYPSGQSDPKPPEEPIHAHMAEIQVKEDEPEKNKMIGKAKTKGKNRWR